MSLVKLIFFKRKLCQMATKTYKWQIQQTTLILMRVLSKYPN